MKPRLPLFAPLLLLLLLATPSCVLGNHTFAAYGDEGPDVVPLDKALAAAQADPDGRRTLGDFAWYPLIALNAQVYGPSAVDKPEGTTLTDLSAYGPLVMMGSSDIHLYDAERQLLERQQESHFAWGLWRSKETKVRVPYGWRLETQSSLLFGLLRWPSTYYIRDRSGGGSDSP